MSNCAGFFAGFSPLKKTYFPLSALRRVDYAFPSVAGLSLGIGMSLLFGPSLVRVLVEALALTVPAWSVDLFRFWPGKNQAAPVGGRLRTLGRVYPFEGDRNG